MLDRTGSYRWMLARGLAQRGGDGVCRRMVGSIGDITDIKRREQSARANEARFRALVGMSGAIFLVVDRNGLIQEANREAERGLAPGGEDVVGLSWRSLLDDDAAVAFGRQLSSVAGGRAVRGFEHALRSESDDPRVLLWNIDRFESWGPGGREVLLICAGQDITIRKRAENA
ncbi:PAS domain S-box protein, partial [bacterium]|nr:PAS domain S-box protein [bacterium]